MHDEEEIDHPVDNSDVEVDEKISKSDSDSDLPEEPDWAKLEENAPTARSSTESEEDDLPEDDSRNYVRWLPNTVYYFEWKSDLCACETLKITGFLFYFWQSQCHLYNGYIEKDILTQWYHQGEQ